MNSEETKVMASNDEATRIMNDEETRKTIEANKDQVAGSKPMAGWKRVTINGLAGVLLGSSATLLMGSGKAEDELAESNESDQEALSVQSTAEESTMGLDVAASVNESMSFGEAFSSARSEVGPGGVFEWHGNLYGTYYGSEWDAMTDEEKDIYWDRVNHTEHPQEEEVEVMETSEPEIEVLGVQMVEGADGSEQIVGMVEIDGAEVVLVDIDVDGTFEVAAADVDGNGQITTEEIVDISDAGLTVEMMQQEMMNQEDYTADTVDPIV